ncbi:hypothetical protein VTK56DRAFT_2317 [Thermocarpiscus australiensis]
MHRSCRAGRSAWQRLVGGTAVPDGRTRLTRIQGATITSQLRSFASRTSTDGPSEINAPLSEGGGEGPGPDRPPGKKVIFSGIQPTGIPHLGNYLGALREWKRLQDTASPDTDLIFSIVDLHALTVPQPKAVFLTWRIQMLAALLAVGLDPHRCTIFYQSDLPANSELQWILSCTASTGYLSRMTQWKSKMQLRPNASLDDAEARRSLKHGLFSYPILQAADILVHRATHVPVGEDQRQHLEFARECVTNFNHTYKTDCLVAPETLISPAKRIMSLTNPLQKMSKSDPSPKSRIHIADSPGDIQKKIREAVTDSTDAVSYDPKARPGVSNLVEILASLDAQGRTPAELGAELAGCRIAELKGLVTKAVCGELAEVRDKFLEFVDRRDLLRDVSALGKSKAEVSAAATMQRVRHAVGLGSI